MKKKRARTKQWTVVQLLDLSKYNVERVERWPGWGKLFLRKKEPEYRCPGCRQLFLWPHSTRWRCLRDLDISSRHIELMVPVYRIECSLCGRREIPISL